MADTTVHEIALLFVGEQRGAAEPLTRELQRQGAVVFCDYFENTELTPHIAAEDLHAGLERAEIVVVLLSRQYVDRAWKRDERHLILSEISEQRGSVVPLCFDDTLVPDGLHPGIDCRGADDYALTQVAEEIGKTFFNHEQQDGGTGVARNPQITSLTSEATWLDYDHGELFVIGRGDLKFETMWSKCNATSIHVYNEAPSIEGVALASGYTSIEQIIDARFLDYKGRTRRLT